MKKIGGLFLLLFSLLFFSCGQSKKTEAENTAMLFLQALKEQNLEKMRELYPGIDNIEIFYASDTAFIDKSTLLSDELILVNATSKYLNEEGKVETRHVGILLIPVVSNADDTYKIVDSYGICSWESYPHANFAVHTGCISPEDRLTDQQAIKQLTTAKNLLFYYSKLLYKDLKENVRIVSSTIVGKDGGKAKGIASVLNASDYTLPDLKYVIVYYDKNNLPLAEDKGWVTQEPFSTGDTIDFDFLTQVIPDAANASFQLDFDLDLILQFVMDDDIYTGQEYALFTSKDVVNI